MHPSTGLRHAGTISRRLAASSFLRRPPTRPSARQIVIGAAGISLSGLLGSFGWGERSSTATALMPNHSSSCQWSSACLC